MIAAWIVYFIGLIIVTVSFYSTSANKNTLFIVGLVIMVLAFIGKIYVQRKKL